MDDDDDSSSSEYTTTTKQVQRQKRSRDMNISVKFSPEQYVQIRLGSESSWITALVLSVLEVAEKRWGFEYKVSYEVKKRGWVTTTIPGNSANIRAFPGL
ncbi:hypothetical protein MKEN_00727600 [Mycena kentingensis (nom. inval.)]|nr:hypothetical protein MKEN_00727600 [Mycena kentingensis (nom. inval.)]